MKLVSQQVPATLLYLNLTQEDLLNIEERINMTSQNLCPCESLVQHLERGIQVDKSITPIANTLIIACMTTNNTFDSARFATNKSGTEIVKTIKSITFEEGKNRQLNKRGLKGFIGRLPKFATIFIPLSFIYHYGPFWFLKHYRHDISVRIPYSVYYFANTFVAVMMSYKL